MRYEGFVTPWADPAWGWVTGQQYLASCTCGWFGVERRRQANAQTDLDIHQTTHPASESVSPAPTGEET